MHAVLFTLASLTPVPLILAAVAFGGAWPWIALAYLTVFAFVMDEIIRAVDDTGSEFPAADTLSVVIGVSCFAVLAAVVWRFGQGQEPLQALALFLAAGLLLGQVGNANAHELIHRPARGLRRLGMWVYIAFLFGHHTSAHPLVHHVHVATPRDPNTPRRGEGYYRFLLRAWAGSFRAGWRAEARRQAGRGRVHPYALYLGGAAMCLAVAFAIGGPKGGAAYLALCFFTQSQLLISDYVQHYGLERAVVNGRAEPVNDTHSWNAPHVFTSHMMLNAPRHSAHHARPMTRFDALPLPAEGAAPMLPYSLPAMSCLALIPPLWRRAMDPRAAYWRRRKEQAEARAAA